MSAFVNESIHPKSGQHEKRLDFFMLVILISRNGRNSWAKQRRAGEEEDLSSIVIPRIGSELVTETKVFAGQAIQVQRAQSGSAKPNCERSLGFDAVPDLGILYRVIPASGFLACARAFRG